MKYSILATAFSFFLIGLALLISPDVSYAQAGGLVPCDGPECNLCDLAQLAENVINFIVQISFVIAALLFAYAGFLMFTAGADPGKVSSARKIFTDTIVGIIIILTAWLVVNVILTVLTGQGVNPFTSVLCEGTSRSSSQPQTTNNSSTGGDFGSGAGGGNTSSGIDVSGSSNTQTDNVNQFPGENELIQPSSGSVPVSPGTGIKSIILDNGDSSGAAAFLNSCETGNVGSGCAVFDEINGCEKVKYTCY